MVRYGGVQGLDALVRRHPRLINAQSGSLCALEFGLNSYRRSIQYGFREGCPVGVIELFDNNPIVCAERVCLPSPAATLALLAVDPLCKAGAIRQKVRLSCSSDCSVNEVEAFLQALGDRINVETSSDLHCDDSSVAIALSLPMDLAPNEVEDLYGEAYSRTMLVMQSPRVHPVAAEYSVCSDGGALQIKFESKLEGKAGAAQVIQALNVMAGFEDSLGIG